MSSFDGLTHAEVGDAVDQLVAQVAALTSGLTAETSARQAQDIADGAAWLAAVNAEAAARAAADSQDVTDDAAEVAARTAADAAEQTRALLAEGNVAAAAQTALTSAVSALNGSLALKLDITAAAGSYESIVVHGATGSTARPTGAIRVKWIGSATPVNATVGDVWRDLTTPGSPVEKVVTAVGPQVFVNLGAAVAAKSITFDKLGLDITDRVENPDNSGTVPRFAKYAGNPVVTAAQVGIPTIYGACVLYVRGILGGAALDDYYMWTSTDHSTANGGIYLLTAPTPLGPWTTQGKVYEDGTSGSQTETPCVRWNPEEQLFFLYYQQLGPTGAIGAQVSLLATSANGRTGWTRVGIVLDVYGPRLTGGGGPEDQGSGHCGYMNVGRVGKLWWATSLKGGRYGLWWSEDGRKWFGDARGLLGHDISSTPGGTPKYRAWSYYEIAHYRGRPWAVITLNSFQSGTGAATNAVMGMVPLADDYRTQLSRFTEVLTVDPAISWEASGDVRWLSSFQDKDGQMYLYYTIAGAIGVAAQV